MSMLRWVIPIALLVAATSLSGCGFPGEDFEQFSLSLHVDSPSELYAGGSRIVLDFVPRGSWDEATIGISLPDGFELISGNPVLDEPWEQGEGLRVEIMARATTADPLLIRGWATTQPTCEGSMVSETIGLQVQKINGKARVQEVDPPRPDATVSIGLSSANSRVLQVETQADHAFPGRVCLDLVSAKGTLVATSGSPGWVGMIPTGRATVNSVEVEAPEPGTYIVQGWLYPHASVTTDAVGTQISLKTTSSGFTVASG